METVCYRLWKRYVTAYGNGMLLVRHGMLPVRHGMLPVRHGMLPVRHGMLPVRHGMLPVRYGMLPNLTNSLTLKRIHNNILVGVLSESLLHW